MFAGVKGFFKSVSAVATDAYFNLVTLLLPGNGTNGAQNNTFLDSSTNNFTITRNGNTTQGTFSPFSQTGWGWNFPSGTVTTNQKITATLASSLGTGNFTHEFSFYPTALPSGFNALVFDGGTNSIVILYESTGQLSVTARDGTGAATTVISASSSTAVNLNQWNTVSVIRSGTGSGQVSLYINGVLATTGTLAANLTGTGFNLCGRYVVDGSNWYPATGYISNYRISNVARSSAVPTAPLSSDANTLILLCQANRFIDASANAITLTVNGTPSVQAFSPFAPTAAYSAATNGGSGYFDGTGDYLTLATGQTALLLGNSDFTLEAWVYKTATGTNGIFSGQSDFATGAGSSYSFVLSSSTTSDLYVGGSAYAITSPNPTINQWVHVAWVRTGGTYSSYLNGSRVGTLSTLGTSSVNNGSTTYPPAIGAWGSGGAPLTGYISGLRLIKGSGGYNATNSTITIPTTPPTAITNTSLLCNFTNAGITDATAKNVLETVGNAQISTTQSKFGGSSMYFDGTGDYLFARYNPNLEFGSGNFTVECWVYFSTLPSNDFAAITSYGDADGTPRWIFYYDSRTAQGAPGLRFSAVDAAGTLVLDVVGGGTSGWAANTWYHVAITRSGNSWRLFRDGTQTGSTVTDTDAIPAATNNGLYVSSEPTVIALLTGYIDDLRITKGYARYTANFTAPTAAFPTQ